MHIVVGVGAKHRKFEHYLQVREAGNDHALVLRMNSFELPEQRKTWDGWVCRGHSSPPAVNQQIKGLGLVWWSIAAT